MVATAIIYVLYTFFERQQLEDINGYYGHQNLGADLSSYVAVVGAPTR